jgi:hypothetical protein
MQSSVDNALVEAFTATALEAGQGNLNGALLYLQARFLDEARTAREGKPNVRGIATDARDAYEVAIVRMKARINAKAHRTAWLREAVRHQHNAAYSAAMAMGNRELGNLDLACSWQRGADASAYNARCNLFAAMNIKSDT